MKKIDNPSVYCFLLTDDNKQERMLLNNRENKVAIYLVLKNKELYWMFNNFFLTALNRDRNETATIDNFAVNTADITALYRFCNNAEEIKHLRKTKTENKQKK